MPHLVGDGEGGREPNVLVDGARAFALAHAGHGRQAQRPTRLVLVRANVIPGASTDQLIHVQHSV